ncbi:MAG: hypothetical protein WCO19_05240, partial [Candidatus Saccharibacteria bacterium]
MKYTSRLIGKKSLQYILLVFVFVAIVQIFSPAKASAAIEENRGGIPTQFTSDSGGIENVETCAPFRYTNYTWVSKTTDTTQRNITIATGQTEEFLALNYLGAVCNNGIKDSIVKSKTISTITNPDKDYVRENIVSINASDTNGVVYPIQGISAKDFIDIDYNYTGGCYSSPNCRYFKTSRDGNPFARAFLLSGFGSFLPGKSYDIDLKVTVREIVQQNDTDLNQKKCIGNDASGKIIIAENMNDPRCPTKDLIYPIHIYVKPTPDEPPVGTATTECSNLKLSGLSDSNYSPAGGNGYDLFYDMGPAKEGFITRGKASGGSATIDMPSLGIQLNDRIRVRITNYDYQGNVDDIKSVMINGLRYSPGPSCPNYEIKESPSVKLKAADGVTDDDEDPKNADFAGNVQAESIYGGPITVKNVTVTCAYRLEKASGADGTPASWVPNVQPGQNVFNNPSNANCGPIKALPSTVASGDKICLRITVSPGKGRVEVSGKRMNTAPESDTTKEECARIVNKPYVSFYGSDIRADENSTCHNPVVSVAGINTNRKTSGGSSTEFGAFALGAITGISYSRSFAETDIRGPGYFGSYPNCSSGYLDVGGSPITNPSITIGSSGKYSKNDNLVIEGGNVDAGEKIFISVVGDITITKPITFASSGWTDRSNIPSLYIYATGNI